MNCSAERAADGSSESIVPKDFTEEVSLDPEVFGKCAARARVHDGRRSFIGFGSDDMRRSSSSGRGLAAASVAAHFTFHDGRCMEQNLAAMDVSSHGTLNTYVWRRVHFPMQREATG